MKKWRLKEEVKEAIKAGIILLLTLFLGTAILVYNVDQTEQQQIVEKN